MTRTTITPQLLHDFLEVHAIGADALGGAGLVENKSIDRDHTEVSINGVYDLSAVANELDMIDQTGTSHDMQQGVRRLLIVAAVLWFSYWSAVLFLALKDYRYALRYYPGELSAYLDTARNRVCGSIAAAIVWPIIVYVVFLTLRWIWRGFRGNRSA